VLARFGGPGDDGAEESVGDGIGAQEAAARPPATQPPLPLPPTPPAAPMPLVHEARAEAAAAEPPMNPEVRRSRHPGVTWQKRISKWQARIKSAGVMLHLLTTSDEEEAALAYSMARENLDRTGIMQKVYKKPRM
jgi:hypothetical protein